MIARALPAAQISRILRCILRFVMLKNAQICAAGIALFCLTGVVTANQSAQMQRYEKLAAELRCLVCQNQSLADSSADLAQDLKREVRTLISQGKTDAEIKAYMQSRYGDFVLYRPPLQGNTALLWLGPFVGLAGAAGVAAWMMRKRKSVRQEPSAPLSEEDRRELEARLK